MIQAAASKAVDFSEARLLDRHWWTTLFWILDRIEANNLAEIQKLQHIQNCALLKYGIGERAFDLHWDHASKLVETSWKAHFPWEKAAGVTAGNGDALRDAWVSRWGDPNSPETMARIKLTADYLTGMMERAAQARKRPQRRILRRNLIPGRVRR